MRAAAKYFWIALISAKSNLAYLPEVASRVIFLGVVLYIFLRLWTVTYSETGTETLAGMTLVQMLWYLVVTESIVLSAPRVAQAVDQDVRTGQLAIQLVRPLSYPLYRLSSTLGERCVRFFLNLGVGSLIALLLVGPLDLQPAGLLIFLLSLPLAFALDFLGSFLIGLCAFWLEDTSGLLLIYSRVTMVVGGMLIPIELFPDAVKGLVMALPFAAMVYGPARLLVLPAWSALAGLIIQQALACAVAGCLVALIYRSAVRRLFANGG